MHYSNTTCARMQTLTPRLLHALRLLHLYYNQFCARFPISIYVVNKHARTVMINVYYGLSLSYIQLVFIGNI